MKTALSFGGWLKRQRGGLGLTQKELAQQVGYAEVTLRKVEADELRPSRQMAQKLAESLQIAPEDQVQFVRFARDELGWDEVALPTQVLTVALPSLPTNLPIPLTSLIGRKREVADIVNLLLRPDVRLVTLTGPGGTGKTRLAIYVAAQIYDGKLGVDKQSIPDLSVKDGVFFVDLAPLRDPELVLSAVAQSLDLRGQGASSLLDMLKERLRSKHLLLVLDNFEHLIEAAATIADLLTMVPALKVLVTSRRSLRVRGEVEYVIPPLMAPEPNHISDWRSLAEFEAIQLFIQRTLAIKPDFERTAEHVQAVAAICHRLDGLPLAIELSAARMKIFSPQMLLQRLRRRLLLLSGGARDLPQRQQTMRNTIAWSYDLLSTSEKTLFIRLAVFAGGCTLDVADAVCNADGAFGMDLLDGLTSLTDQCLLFVETKTAESRFMMSQTIHEFALEYLEASNEVELIRRQHALYYLELTKEFDPKHRNAKLALELRQLLKEQDNLRSALQWCLANGEPEWALQLAARLSGFWELYGDLIEGQHWLDNALKGAQSRSPNESSANALFGYGILLLRQGNYVEASHLLHKSLTWWQAANDRLGIALTLTYLGNLSLETGFLQEAERCYEESLALFRELNFTTGVGMGIGNMGLVALMSGDSQKSYLLQEESLAILREVDAGLYMSMVLGGIGLSLLLQGNVENARQSIVASIKGLAEVGERWWLGYDLALLAMVAVAQQQWLRAARLLGAAAALRELRHSSLAPVFRPALESTIATVEGSLGIDNFSVALQEGRAMTLEQVLAYAAVTDIIC